MRVGSFIVGEPVPPHMFYDRREILKSFRRMLETGIMEPLAIVGPLRLGKTSLLLKLASIAREYNYVIPVLLLLQRISDPFVELFSQVVTRELGRPPESISPSALRDDDMKSLVSFVQAEERGDADVERAMKSLVRYLERREKVVILFIDEFQEWARRVTEAGYFRGWHEKSIYWYLRGWQETGRIKLVVTGSALEDLLRVLDYWNGRFRIIRLPAFPREDSVRMLLELFEKSGMPISRELAEEIADSMGDHPYYMQLLGALLMEKGEISKRAIIEVKKEILSRLLDVFETAYRKLLDWNPNAVRILRMIATGRRFPWELSDVPNAHEIVRELVRRGVLIRNRDGSLTFVDRLFERYIMTIESIPEPVDVAIVGHWAERLVGNKLISEGFHPYYSHDSRGAFDIFVPLKRGGVGIQVRYRTSGEVTLSEEEFNRIMNAAREMGWIPVLALVSRRVVFVKVDRPGKYTERDGTTSLRELLRSAGIRVD